MYISATGLSLGDPDEYTNPTESTIRNKKSTEQFTEKAQKI
ncbi:hypothetical protein [Clostridium sp.]|nr:hypothetical protein [Clostridium sp.]